MIEVKVDGHLITININNVIDDDGIVKREERSKIELTVAEADQIIRDLKPAIIKARVAEKLLAKDSLKTLEQEATEKMRELENLKRRMGQLREKSK